MTILEIELYKGVNIKLTQSIYQRKLTRYPYVKSVARYHVEWQVPGSSGWMPIGEFRTQKQATTHIGKMVKASKKLEFKLTNNEQPRQAIQTTAI
jgi:hypothetical protein